MRGFDRFRGPLSVLAVLLFATTSASAEWAEWIADATAAFEYTANLNFAAFDADEKDDVSWRPSALVGRVYQLTNRTRVSLTAEADGRVFDEFRGLNGATAGGSLAAIHKFGLGTAPWIRAYVFGGYDSAQDDDRSGRWSEVGARAGKRFSRRFDASIAYLYLNRTGGNGSKADLMPPKKPGLRALMQESGTDVFDQVSHAVELSGNLLLTPRILFSTRYRYRNGDFESWCSRGTMAEGLARERSNVRALTADDTFGGCVYRLQGDVHLGRVNVNYALWKQLSFDVGYRFQRGEGRSLTYNTHAVRVALLFSY